MPSIPVPVEAVLYVVSAIVLLRLSGKQTISQMTPGEVVIMIGLGTVLVHPLKTENPWLSIYHGALIVLVLIIVYYVLMYVPAIKKLLTGKPLLLIKDGRILKKNLKKARMTTDELNMRLRIKQINQLSKVKRATLEVSGDLGLELNADDNYATKKELEDLKKELLKKIENPTTTHPPFKYEKQQSKNLFDDIN